MPARPRSLLDRAPRLVIHPHNESLDRRPPVVDAIGRHRPGLYTASIEQADFRPLELTGRDLQEDAIDTLQYRGCGGRIVLGDEALDISQFSPRSPRERELHV